MRDYLQKVEDGTIVANQKIVQNIQPIFNLSPDITRYTEQFAVNTNDVLATIYLSSLVKSVLAIHDLIRNKNDHSFKLRKEAEEREKAAAQEQAAEEPAAAPEQEKHQN